MTKLTLPIQVGKKYLRRDGSIIKMVKLSPSCGVICGYSTSSSVFASTGLTSSTIGNESAWDVVADYIEPTEENHMTQEHSHAHILRWIADGKQVQQKYKIGWETQSAGRTLLSLINNVHPDYFRLVPKTHFINGVECPAPETEALECGAIYWTPSLSERVFYASYIWDDDAVDHRLLSCGLIHLTKEAAIENCKAMLAFKESA